LIGITQGNISVAVSEKRLVGEIGWLADGGYKRNVNKGDSTPARPRLFVSRASATELARIKSMPTLKAVAHRIGMSSEAVTRNFVETGRLSTEITPSRVLVDPVSAVNLQGVLLAAVLDSLEPHRWMTRQELTVLFNKRHGSLFLEGRALQGWVDKWLGELLVAGRVRRRQEMFCAADGTRHTSSGTAGVDIQARGLPPVPDCNDKVA
jgi:hypothetical protein